MIKQSMLALAIAAGGAWGVSNPAQAANIADVTLEITFTLDSVLINDTTPATFETTSDVGDILFEDYGPNSNFFSGGSGANPPGSVGDASADESVLLNGLDPFVDDYDQDSFGIGDSLVVTQNVFASSTTPGSVFFAQVDGQHTFFFSQFLSSSDALTFFWSYEATLTGTLDNTMAPGDAFVFADGTSVEAEVEFPEDGDGFSFTAVADPYFTITEVNPPNTLDILNVTESGSFEVVFGPGDDGLVIDFYTSIVVNANTEIPEPATASLIAAGVLGMMRRRR